MASQGIIELSENGTIWKKIADFTHGGKFCEIPQDVSVGKVPFNGEPTDLPEADAGTVGTSMWDELALY